MTHRFPVWSAVSAALLLAALAGRVDAQPPRSVTIITPKDTAKAKARKPDVGRPAPAPVPVDEHYWLVPGDKLRIEVYRDQQLSQSVQIRPDGKITLPLIGDVEAQGVAPIELRDRIAEALKEYVNNPVVTVIVVEAMTPTAYVVGEVNTPGAVALQGQLTVSSFPGWTTPCIGFNLRPGYSRAGMLAPLVRWAFGALRCVHLEVSDRGFRSSDADGLPLESSEYASYSSDLTRSEEALFAGMTGACRRCIRKAEKSGVVVEEVRDPEFADEYYQQLVDVFARQGRVPTYSVERVRLLLRHLGPTGRLLAVRARSPEGRSIATGLYAGMNDTAFFWGNASWRAEAHWRPNELLHWYALRYWKVRGARMFDWGGGGTYKEKYGVEPYVVPWFCRSKYGLLMRLRNDARRTYYRSQRLVGRLRGVKPPPAVLPAPSPPACGGARPG